MARAQPSTGGEVQIFEDEEQDTEMNESGVSRDDSDGEDEQVDDSVAEDLASFEHSFKDITKRFRLINRIGEGKSPLLVHSAIYMSSTRADKPAAGTFSTVYKAEDLEYNLHINDWDTEEKENAKWSTEPKRNLKPNKPRTKRARYVAIKKIYVTSSPIRIFNELELLHDLENSSSVCPLITAFRHHDQVVAVLPYFQHRDFRDYFRDMTVIDMRFYFRSLLVALSNVHERGILHRDIKPTNFLYNPSRSRGVLVDFGLAEREGTDWSPCLCDTATEEREIRVQNSLHYSNYTGNEQSQPMCPNPKHDNRPSRRANRAGTRGFRAPEVLLKCTNQTTAIDIWSAGVILLSVLSRRFPFFNSTDDIDALLELTQIFGRRRMRETAQLHGQIFETNIPSYSESGHSLEKLILWCTNRSGRDEQGRRMGALTSEEREAVEFLGRLMECDPRKRITAADALNHPFIADVGREWAEDDVDLVSHGVSATQ